VNRDRILLLTIVVATMVCVLGVLILPQVDLPDFVLNGSKVPTITAVHTNPASSSPGFGGSDIVSLAPRSSSFRQSSLTFADASAFFALEIFLPLRC
jgi:hypothetical protein